MEAVPVQLKTSRFGEVSIASETILHFPEGLIGFYDNTRYVILDHKPGRPFKWLQSVDDPDLAFIIVDPAQFKPDYNPVLMKSDLDSLQLSSQEDASFYAIVVVPEDPKKMYANLLGPLVINRKARIGKQLILATDKYTTCHYIVEEMAAACGRKNARTLS